MKAQKTSKERGAALVEFAIVMPLFILLLFGIMEAGWAFSQQVEVRNAAREGARLAVVNTVDLVADTMRTEVCNRAPLSSPGASVKFTKDLGADTAKVEIEQIYQSLTGIVPAFNNPITIRASSKMRLERPVSWASDAGFVPCP